MFTGAIAIVLIWVGLDWLIRSGFARAGRLVPNIPATRLLFVERTARIALLLFVFISFSEFFGFAPQDLWTAFSTILALIAVALVAFWSALSSLVCGLMLIISRPFNVGDTIEIFDPSATDKPGTRGTVLEMGALYMVLQDAGQNGQRIFIPHNQVMQRAIRVFPHSSKP